MVKIHRIILFLIFFIYVIQAQTAFKIADYKIFPPEIEILDIKPDIIEWGVGGSYLLLDKVNHQLVSVGSLSGIQMVGGFGRKAVSFSEPIWVGVAPDGILLIDRLENKVISLDYRLTYMYDISLEPRLYPDLAAIDNWGTVYMYSSQYHSIFAFKQNTLIQNPHIDLREFNDIGYCLSQIEINQGGNIGILGCDNTVHIFSRHGKYQNSYYPDLVSVDFLVAIRDDWLLFNKNGDGLSLLSNESITIPGVSVPIKDIKSMNKSVAILSKDHILILNAQSN